VTVEIGVQVKATYDPKREFKESLCGKLIHNFLKDGIF
jgi:hypothetical protein